MANEQNWLYVLGQEAEPGQGGNTKMQRSRGHGHSRISSLAKQTEPKHKVNTNRPQSYYRPYFRTCSIHSIPLTLSEHRTCWTVLSTSEQCLGDQNSERFSKIVFRLPPFHLPPSLASRPGVRASPSRP